ncbi:MAG TPA: hypothetical protein VJT33_00215 [bacterium]|nr:hypothetical protein [bacterium]
MAVISRGAGLLAIVLLVSACGGPSGIGLTPADWDKVYQASLAYENAMGIARRSAQTWTASRHDRDGVQALRQQVTALTGEARAAADGAPECTSTSMGEVCAAVKSLRDTSGASVLAMASTNLGAAEAALTSLQHTHDALIQDYATAGESWNAWVRTLMMVVANYDQVSAWPDYGRRRDQAVAAVTAFTNGHEDRTLADQSAALTVALKAGSSSLTALSRALVTARGQAPETTATGAAGPTAATGIAQTQTGAASSVSLAPGFSIDPTGIIQQLIQSQYAAQLERQKEARAGVLSELRNLLWPDYSCFEAPSVACPGFLPAR